MFLVASAKNVSSLHHIAKAIWSPLNLSMLSHHLLCNAREWQSQVSILSYHLWHNGSHKLYKTQDTIMPYMAQCKGVYSVWHTTGEWFHLVNGQTEWLAPRQLIYIPSILQWINNYACVYIWLKGSGVKYKNKFLFIGSPSQSGKTAPTQKNLLWSNIIWSPDLVYWAS